MEKFSNETKKERRKAILKVILKRYSFIVWVPLLVIFFNFIGITFFSLIAGLTVLYEGNIIIITFIEYLLYASVGFLICFELFIIILIGIECICDLLKYLKKGTIVEDFIYNVKLVAEALVNIFLSIILIPKKIFLRIKDEKRQFNNAIEKEIGKNL